MHIKPLLAIAVFAVVFPLSLAMLGGPAESQFFSRPCGGPPDPPVGLPGFPPRLDESCVEIRGIDGKCLDAAGGSSADGTPVILWPCHGGSNQRWKVLPNGTVLGINGKCLDALGGRSENGTPVIIWTCHGGDNQRWEITDNHQLLGIGNQCLDASGFGLANGAPIILWACHGGANQRWDARFAQ